MEPKQAARPMPKRCLVTDEIVELTTPINPNSNFRIRIWRGKDATPIVLASPAINSHGKYCWPRLMTSKLAMLALSVAGYPQSGIIYFEYESRPPGEAELHSVHFGFFGPSTRLRLHNPVYHPYEWRTLETIVGESIER